MKWKDFKDKTNKFLIIDTEIVQALEKREFSARGNIYYWLKNGKLISLKRGMYLDREKYNIESNKEAFLEYVAGKLLEPSYLSLEYVMSKYQLLSEPVYTITSVTTSTTRLVKNDLGYFRYYSITPQLFNGYKIKYFCGAPIKEAEKEKAVFDFLYLRFVGSGNINEKAIEELRINWDNINKKEWKKVKSFGMLSKSSRVKKVLCLIEKMYY